MRLSSIVLVSTLSVAVLGCSGSSKKEAEEPDTSWDMGDADPDPAPAPSPEPEASDDDDEDEPDPAPKPKPLTQDDDYEINHRDCDALAQAYGGAWLRDEMKKLNERKLKKAQFDKAKAQVETDAESMKDNWREECYKTVGTAYLRSRLKCAMKAKSLKRFNDCMDGLADP
jgi:hypothetical protein